MRCNDITRTSKQPKIKYLNIREIEEDIKPENLSLKVSQKRKLKEPINKP